MVAWYRRPGVVCAAGVFLAALAVYSLTLAPTLSFWDCGEFISAAHTLGVPHQPGTPLHVLAARCFDILLGWLLSTAVACNWLSAVAGALGVMMTYLVIVDIARRADRDSGWLAHAGALVGALFLLFSDTYWNNSIETEVYGLAGFIVALLTWLGLRWYDARDDDRGVGILYLIFYLLALGIGFHLGSLLVYPGFFVLVLLARNQRIPAFDVFLASGILALFLFSTITKNDGLLIGLLVLYLIAIVWRATSGRRFALVAAGLFALGISVHLYLLIRARHAPHINMSQPDNLKDLMGVLRREQYPPIDPFQRQAPLVWQFRYYYDFLVRQFWFLGDGTSVAARMATFLGPIFLGILGIIHGLRRARPWIWMLIVGYLINGEILTLYLNFTDHEVRERDYFYGTAFMFFAMFIGLGASALLRYAAGPEAKGAAAAPPVRAARPGPAARPAAVAAAEAPPPPSPIRPGRLAWAGAALLLLIAVMPALLPRPYNRKWFEHDRHQNWVPREYAWNMLAGLDPHAILFTNGDNDTYPLWYLQEVEHFRTDVTIINLSLVNLPWYVKQWRQRDPDLPLKYSDAELDKLQAQVFRDPKTGETQIVYVKDYVVHDMLQANHERTNPRPAFFAVTIPEDNMALYWPFLKMEGLAFRLVNERQPHDAPGTNGERMLENMFGIYDYRATLTGNTPKRWREFRKQAGLPAGEVGGTPQPLQPGTTLPQPTLDKVDYASLVSALGSMRTDVFRDQNQSNLLQNYPAAAGKAGWEYLNDAELVPEADTTTYDHLIDRSYASLELGRSFDPAFPMVREFYPLILMEKGRTAEAFQALQTLHGRLSPAEEGDVLTQVMLPMARAGHGSEAIEFLEARIKAEPHERTAYAVLMSLQLALGDSNAARATLARWRQASGRSDPEMERALQRALSPPASGQGAAGGEGSPGGGAATSPGGRAP